MFLTEKEIMSQHIALQKTFTYMLEKRDVVQEFFKNCPNKKFVFFGCGSSYMLSKSGQRLFASCKNTSAYAIAGGDYLIDPSNYEETIKDSIIVTLSRSGQTSEIVRAVKSIKEKHGNPVISISMKAENALMEFSDLDITMDWCYDMSVCQTRTVTNLYASLLMLVGFYKEDSTLIQSVEAAVEANEEYKEKIRPILEEIAKKPWDKVVVLADGANVGIGEEGALAFTEIALIPGCCFNLLDYRHGPIVLNNEKTLTIVLVNPKEYNLQKDMIQDLKTHGGSVVTVSEFLSNEFGVDANISINGIASFEAWGIPFIYVMQMIALSKAIVLGTNPDEPVGLDAFITLK